MKVIVTGATGLIGRHLVPVLAGRGDAVVALTRGSARVPGAHTVQWDPSRDALPAAAVDGADAIVNLAGAGIGDRRWSDDRSREILESRVSATRRCVAALGADGPRILVNASAMGYYGDGEDAFDENSPPGNDFLASVCVAWEQEAIKGEASGARVVRLRTGHVLARDGGLLGSMLLPARLGVGGPLGSGKQWMSWIHVTDEVGIIVKALETDMSGAFNATAPNPVRQVEMAKMLGRILKRPAFIPTPRIALRVLLGGIADIAVTGQKVVPTAALAAGYTFAFPSLEPALRDLLEK